MDFLPLCSVAWTVSIDGTLSCPGVVTFVTQDSVSGVSVITAEMAMEFAPWALGLFVTAFGIRMMRRVILSRG